MNKLYELKIYENEYRIKELRSYDLTDINKFVSDNLHYFLNSKYSFHCSIANEYFHDITWIGKLDWDKELNKFEDYNG